MKTYQSIKIKNSNRVVLELNARVLSATFETQEGSHLADLYTYEGTQCRNPKEIVAHKTCAPIMGVFVETIIIKF